jgi:hypothetical protein
MRVSLASVLLLGLTLVAAETRANGPPFLLGATGCGELDEREMRRLVAAELGAIQVEQRGPGVTLVSVHCGGLRVVIRVDDPLSKKTVQRAFDTGPMDHRARARWIALAASELVLSSWVELETNPAPQVQPEGPAVPAPVRRAAQAAVRRLTPPPPAPRAPAPVGAAGGVTTSAGTESKSSEEPQTGGGNHEDPDHQRSFRAVALGSVRTFFNDDGTLWGGGMRFSEERFRHMSWSADFLFEAGSIDTAKADYRVRSGSIGGWLMLYARRRVVTARVGAGLRVGFAASLAENTSTDYEGSRNSGAVAPWGWPLAAASLSIDLGPLVTELAFESGYVVLPVGGSGGASVAGGWFSAQLGLGVRQQTAAPSAKRAR